MAKKSRDFADPESDTTSLGSSSGEILAVLNEYADGILLCRMRFF